MGKDENEVKDALGRIEGLAFCLRHGTSPEANKSSVKNPTWQDVQRGIQGLEFGMRHGLRDFSPTGGTSSNPDKKDLLGRLARIEDHLRHGYKK